MKFYIKDTENYKLQIVEPTAKEERVAKNQKRWTNANWGMVVNHDRNIDLYYTEETNEELLNRMYLYSL